MSPTAVRWLITLNAAVGMASGVALLLVPGHFLSVVGLATDAAGLTFTRLYGAELAGFNVATWLVRSSVPPSRPIVLGHLVNESLTGLIVGAAAWSALGNPVAWLLAGTAGAFALGYLTIALAPRSR